METSNTITVSSYKKIRNSLTLGRLIALGILAAILWSYTNDPKTTVAVLRGTLRHSTPLILGALCGLIGERSGIINIGIEGQMLMSAFTAFIVSAYTGSLIIAIGAGLLTGALLGLLLAFMSVTLKVDQIIGGTVINILALGLSGFYYTQNLTTKGKLPSIDLGLFAEIPLIGEIFTSKGAITYAAIALVFVAHYVLFYTRWGLRTRAVGEHPRAADTVGINVFMMRYANVIIAGAIGGLGGVFLTLEGVGTFSRAMTNGRGFLALAVMIFGKWTPFGAWGAALLFGFAFAMQTQISLSGVLDIPPQFIGMLPYILTIAVLAGFVGRARPPAAEGIPYEKEG